MCWMSDGRQQEPPSTTQRKCSSGQGSKPESHPPLVMHPHSPTSGYTSVATCRPTWQRAWCALGAMPHACRVDKLYTTCMQPTYRQRCASAQYHPSKLPHLQSKPPCHPPPRRTWEPPHPPPSVHGSGASSAAMAPATAGLPVRCSRGSSCSGSATAVPSPSPRCRFEGPFMAS